MAISWDDPQLGNPIRLDVPELQKKLIALLKQDPTSIANIPSGAKRLVNTSGVQWQVQQYNGSSWAAIGKLMHDVDRLDGYHAAITPNANTVAVRNADKKLEGDITGNAATASSAATLSQTLPVNKGGTGATTSAQARTNLGVPPTSHASSNTTYGLGSNVNYGHVRGDGVTTNVVSGEVVAKDIALGGDSADPATGRGYLAKDKVPWYDGNTDAIDDFNALTLPGCYQIRFSSTTQNAPDGVIYNSSGFNDGYIEIFKISSSSTISSYARLCQRLTVFGTDGFTTVRRQQPSSTGAWYSWQRLIDSTDFARASTPGIMQPGDGLKAGSSGVVSVDGTILRTSGDQTATGKKYFNDGVYCRDNIYPFNILSSDIDNTTKPSTTQYQAIFRLLDKNEDMACIGRYIDISDGKKVWEVLVDKVVNGETIEAQLRLTLGSDNVPYVTIPTPPDSSNTNTATTTAWVKRYAPLASTTKAGLVKIGEGLSVGSDGTLKANSFPAPDWAAKQARSFYTSYTATEDGYLFINMCASNYTNGFSVTVGGLTFAMIGKENYGWVTDTVCLPIKKGTTYKTSKAEDYGPGQSKMYFIPVAN